MKLLLVSPLCWRSPTLLPALALTAAAALTTACGADEDEELPSACRVQPAQMRTALAEAPGRVRIEGTAISRCFVKNADAGDVQTVGGTLLAAAAPLAARAERDPEGDAAVRTGYLLGAVRRGAARTQGIHDEVLRRIEQELAHVDHRTAAFRRGERAGLADG